MNRTVAKRSGYAVLHEYTAASPVTVRKAGKTTTLPAKVPTFRPHQTLDRGVGCKLDGSLGRNLAAVSSSPLRSTNFGQGLAARRVA